MLAQYIKKLRTKNNLSQDFVAKKIGVSRPTYLEIEKDKRIFNCETAGLVVKYFT